MNRRTFAHNSFAAVTASAFGLLFQCKSSATKVDEPLGPADQTYTVRGKIVQLPSNKTGTAQIQHEAIPPFQNASKERVGMAAMTMPFNLAPDIRLDSLSVGDPVTFTFEVRWNSEPQLLIRDMSPLPAGTPLTLDH